ncbi:MAG: OmpW family outer membrane protein [Pseudomonadota bacterium]|nr:OmpW family outer membrane protein [Pseudomonadota bacterium]
MSTAMAAGPLAREFYLQVGGGIYGPDFKRADNAKQTIDGSETSTLSIAGLINITLGGGTDEVEPPPENVDVLAFGAMLGYKFTDRLGLELDLDIIFPEIQINDVGGGDVIGGDNNAGEVNILQPEILPVSVNLVYTMFPRGFVSPYVGIGPVMAFLEDGRAWSDSGAVLKFDGPEWGVLAKAGAMLTLTQSSYFFGELRYTYIDEPDVTTRSGTAIEMDSFQAWHIKGGVGFRF